MAIGTLSLLSSNYLILEVIIMIIVTAFIPWGHGESFGMHFGPLNLHVFKHGYIYTDNFCLRQRCKQKR